MDAITIESLADTIGQAVRICMEKGYSVKRIAMLEPSLAVLMVDRRENCPFPEKPFVTWCFSVGGLNTGHYDMTEEVAIADFNSRVERGY